MKIILEEGDKVRVTSTSKWGISFSNDSGGTDHFPVDTTLTCTVTRAWEDYEMGYRYVAETDEGEEIYFGQFNVKVTPLNFHQLST
jgi:hypothetical protein